MRVTTEEPVVNQSPPATRSLAIASAGIQTSQDFAQLMSCLMSDIIEGNIQPSVANATVNAGGKLLKMVELEYKYGAPKPGTAAKSIQLLDR